MSEIWDELDRLHGIGGRIAMATLVATSGTAPKKEGAKMWVGEGGRILGSVTIGGCVDARVVAEADEILASGSRRRLEMSLGDEEAWDFGLTCGGTVEVMIEPVSLGDPADPVVRSYSRIRAEVEAGRCAIAVAPLDSGGARLILLEGGERLGTLGSTALDDAAEARAQEVIARNRSGTIRLEAGDASVDAFFELHGPTATLLVFGASAVAMPLVDLARPLGFRSVVVDARPRFATSERFPGADEIRIGDPAEIALQLPLGPSTCVILLAHDYKFDLPILREVLQHDVAYLGLLGSRGRGRAILDFLREEGVAEELLDRVHVPVGLDIGAQSAAEIALSILAEAVAVRSGRDGGKMRARPPASR
jgi:xanthine dehydrogenase accessory factor